MKNELMEEVIRIALEAGDRIMKIYKEDYHIEQKNDTSPITEADRISHEHIVSELKRISPEIPILSEESADLSWEERKGWEEYWLVDPLDGTKEFIKKNGEFTVNIALIKENFPVAGVVIIPAQNLIYRADVKNGSFRRDYEENEVKLTNNNTLKTDKLKIVGSRSHQSELMQTFVSNFKNYETVAAGSSLKFCLLAEEKADVYPRLGPTSEWDTAAGQCVLECAGGVVLDVSGNTLKYNTKDSVLNPYFIGMRKYDESVLNCFKSLVLNT